MSLQTAVRNTKLFHYRTLFKRAHRGKLELAASVIETEDMLPFSDVVKAASGSIQTPLFYVFVFNPLI